MRRRVIAHRGLAEAFVDYSVQRVSRDEQSPRYHLVGPNTLHWKVATDYVSDQCLMIRAQEQPDVTYLSSRLGIERSAIKDYISFFAGFDTLRAVAILNDK